MTRLNVLILGGTSEASELVARLGPDPRFAPTLSLAGRTRNPVLPDAPCRIGGFGGIDGLVRYLEASRIAALIDATHPFAAEMSRHAVAAAAWARVPLLGLRRPPWIEGPLERWTKVPDMASAAAALGDRPRQVFLAIGRKELAPFRTRPQHAYVVRSVDPPPAGELPPHARVLTARGPFGEAAERALLGSLGVDCLVTKNSGGTATQGKLAAAHDLGIEVVMVARPLLPEVEAVGTAAAAQAWLEDRFGGVHNSAHGETSALRGV